MSDVKACCRFHSLSALLSFSVSARNVWRFSVSFARQSPSRRRHRHLHPHSALRTPARIFRCPPRSDPSNCSFICRNILRHVPPSVGRDPQLGQVRLVRTSAESVSRFSQHPHLQHATQPPHTNKHHAPCTLIHSHTQTVYTTQHTHTGKMATTQQQPQPAKTGWPRTTATSTAGEPMDTKPAPPRSTVANSMSTTRTINL